MLSASQPKSPKAMMVSRLVVDSDRLSDGLWEEFMSLLRSAMSRGSKPFIFEAKTMPLHLHLQGCKNCEKIQSHSPRDGAGTGFNNRFRCVLLKIGFHVSFPISAAVISHVLLRSQPLTKGGPFQEAIRVGADCAPKDRS